MIPIHSSSRSSVWFGTGVELGTALTGREGRGRGEVGVARTGNIFTKSPEKKMGREGRGGESGDRDLDFFLVWIKTRAVGDLWELLLMSTFIRILWDWT